MLGGDDIMEEFQNVQNSIRDEGKPIMLLLSKKEGFGDHAIVAHSIVDLGAEKKIFVYENKVPLSESNAAFFATLKIDSKFLTYVGSEYSFIARSPLLAPTDVSDIIVTGLLDHLVTELQTQNRIRIFIGSPVDPIITDAQGRVTGITGGNELTQIPGSTVSVYGTKKVIDLPFADSYTLTLNGTSEGVMTIQVLVPQESDTRIIQYNNVPVTQNLTASLRINPTSSTGWEMQISNDTEREPDINSLYGESQDNLFLPLISR